MAETGYFVPTNAGNALYAEAIAKGVGVKITRVSVGSGKPDSETDAKALTELVSYVADATATSPVQDGENVNFTIEYRNDLHPEQAGFYLNEYGVWAKLDEDDATEVMILYGCLGDYAQYVEAYDGTHISSRRFPCQLAVGNVSSVTLNFKSSAFVTSEEMAEYVSNKVGDLGEGETVPDLINKTVKQELTTAVSGLTAGSTSFDKILLKDQTTSDLVVLYADNGGLYYDDAQVSTDTTTTQEEE